MDIAIYNKIKNHCIDNYPNEAGGFIIDGDFVAYENSSTNPTEFYEVSPTSYADVVDHIEGLVHSHVTTSYSDWRYGNAHYPSVEDLKTQISWGVPSHILPLLKYEDKFYPDELVTVGDRENLPDLWERPFCFGATDCYGFIRDWLTIEQNKTPPDIAREWNFWNYGKDTYTELLSQSCFTEIDEREIEKGDILLFRLSDTKIPQHGAVYVANNLLAHHPGANKPFDVRNKPKKDLYSRWEKYVVKIVRHTL